MNLPPIITLIASIAAISLVVYSWITRNRWRNDQTNRVLRNIDTDLLDLRNIVERMEITLGGHMMEIIQAIIMGGDPARKCYSCKMQLRATEAHWNPKLDRFHVFIPEAWEEQSRTTPEDCPRRSIPGPPA